ncbi:glucokinase [Dokdonella sp.]|uniref:glucokinase n=1 Tax=Dokdonella sp. TaxID=2291710 RepID=UPI0031C81247|nr:glucokinase [Dokdonella sp.]
MPDSTCLLADVGGTHVRFARVDPTRPNPLAGVASVSYRVAKFPDLASAARQFLAGQGGHVRQGVFAIAGPVDAGSVQMTNHAWTIAQPALMDALGLEALHVINDFVAMSLAITLLGEGDVRALGEPAPPADVASATRGFAVVGPGTGLGAGALICQADRPLALATEGGHLGFAPATDEEIAILRCLAARFGRVSNERLLSGGGLVNLYQALAQIAGTAAEALAPEDITRRAAAGSDPVCSRAVEIFCEVLGAVAGDLVLAYGAWDGAYLAGGLSPVLLPWLQRGGFRKRFEDKGRYAARMTRVPTVAIMHREPGLLGAAACARRQFG